MPTFAAKPLHPTTTPSNLSIISPVLTTSKTAIGNGGTSTRTADIVECVNNYYMAPSGLPGRAIMSSSRNTPREIKREMVSGRVMGVVLIDMLERHPFTTQAFSPLGGDPKQPKQYLVVVAENDPATDKPDLATLQAFTVYGNEGVCYKENAWHAPMCVLAGTTDFTIFQYGNGVGNEDCELYPLTEPVRILF